MGAPWAGSSWVMFSVVEVAVDRAGVLRPPVAVEQTPAVDGVERLEAAQVAGVFRGAAMGCRRHAPG